ncbi:hypothetical protein MMC12_001001 [Toensbergia leucococca]|nr:hypothetical protein [Toensbergia leucococca]
MPTESTPRINSRHLSSFPHSTIRLLGRVTSLHGETAILDAGGSVTVHLNRDAHLTLNSAVEIVGKVQPDMSIKVFQATDFGTNIGNPLSPPLRRYHSTSATTPTIYPISSPTITFLGRSSKRANGIRDSQIDRFQSRRSGRGCDASIQGDFL